MARRRGRTTPCDPAERIGRLRKAEQFLEAANVIDSSSVEERELTDAYVALCVQAGIAAADAICCSRLGEHSVSDDHASAVELLARVDRSAANSLSTLLGLKTRAEYSAATTSRADQKRAARAATALVAIARTSR